MVHRDSIAAMAWLYIRFTFLLNLATRCSLTSDSSDYHFTREPISTWNVSLYRLTATRWEGMSSTLTCARTVIRSCPGSRGYFFEPGSGVCTPVVRLHEESGVLSSEAPAGVLYLTTDVVCPEPFQAFEYGSDNHVTCLHKMDAGSTYEEATSVCNSRGGYLASVKTAEKLALVATLAGSEMMWLGLDEKVSVGQYVWQEDGSTAMEAMFGLGEPTNPGVEECVMFWAPVGGLADFVCRSICSALCETRPLDSQC